MDRRNFLASLLGAAVIPMPTPLPWKPKEIVTLCAGLEPSKAVLGVPFNRDCPPGEWAQTFEYIDMPMVLLKSGEMMYWNRGEAIRMVKPDNA